MSLPGYQRFFKPSYLTNLGHRIPSLDACPSAKLESGAIVRDRRSAAAGARPPSIMAQAFPNSALSVDRLSRELYRSARKARLAPRVADRCSFESRRRKLSSRLDYYLIAVFIACTTWAIRRRRRSHLVRPAGGTCLIVNLSANYDLENRTESDGENGLLALDHGVGTSRLSKAQEVGLCSRCAVVEKRLRRSGCRRRIFAAFFHPPGR